MMTTTRGASRSTGQLIGPLIGSLSRAERSSWAIQRALLSRGVSTLRLPRGVVSGHDTAPVPELAFAGFRGPGSSAAGASLTEHAPSVLALLEAKGLPVAPGRSFRSDSTQVHRHVESVGYPVFLRPANSESSHRMRRVARTPEELTAALGDIQRTAMPRHVFARDVVAREVSAREVSSEPETRSVWVQKAPTGRLLRVLVAGAKALAAVVGDVDSSDLEPVPIHQVHSDIRHVVVQALVAIPGLDLGEIELVASDPAAGADDQELTILSIGPAELDTYEMNGDGGLQIAAAVVDHDLARSAVQVLQDSAAREVTTVYQGIGNPEKFAARLRATIRDVGGRHASTQVSADGHARVRLECRGDVTLAAWLSLAGVRDLGRGQRASSALSTVHP